ncbi:MAG: hypothetical protein ABR909_06900 [Candidatus Bathyarchaeia archaeon]|jgi:hypothetical protein
MNQTKALKILVVILTVSIILTQTISAAQTPSPLTVDDNLVNVLPAHVIWEKNYGVLGDDDRAYNALAAGDGYLVVGSSESNKTGVTVGWVLRLDTDGNVIWNQTFLEGSGTELRFALNLTDGFLLVGNEFLPSGDENGYVAKINSQGALIWQTTISGEGLNKLFSAIATQDGFVLFGLTYSNVSGDSAAWVVKLDTNGNVVWNKTYGNAAETAATTGVLASDGDYMVAGYTNPRGESNYDFLLMQIDPAGNMIWNKTYGGTGSQEASAMTKASDGYVIVGDTQSPDSNMHAWVVKVDWNGTMLWAKTVGGKNADSPSCITPSEDGGYLVGGFTFSFGAGNRDFWLFKIDDSGQVMWSCTQGNAGYQEAYSVIEAGKNQYVMVGWTDPPGQPALIGKARYMFYIVNLSYPLDSNGLSSFQFISYAVIVFAILLAAWFVVFKLRHKPNTNQTVDEQSKNKPSGFQNYYYLYLQNGQLNRPNPCPLFATQTTKQKAYPYLHFKSIFQGNSAPTYW